MRTLIGAVLVFIAAPAFAEPLQAAAQSGEAKEKFSLIHVDQLATMLKGGKVQVFDANDPGFRDAHGIVPGAQLLPGFKFDPAAILPPDKSTPIVFYCANSH